MQRATLLVALLCLCGGAAVRGDASAGQPVYTTTGGALPGVPPMGGVLGTLKTSLAAAAAPIGESLSQMHAALQAQYQAVTGQLETVVAAAEAEYCTPPSFTPSVKKPAKFVGSSFSVAFLLGGCAFNQTAYVEQGLKVLNCTEPSITYSKSPANFTSKYHTAPMFVSKECKVTKTFGEESEKVLFVFDGTQAPDMNSLIAKINEEVKALMGTIGSSAASLMGSAGGLGGGLWGGA